MNPDIESEAKFWARTIDSILSSLNSLLDKMGSISPWFRHWLNRPVILPSQRAHWWHMGSTEDKQPTMQIVSYWYVTNRTNRPINILNAYIKNPKTQGHVMLKDVNSAYHGNYPVPPHTTTDLHADFWVHPPFRKEGKDFKVDIVFVDQYGQKRTIRNVEFKSDKRKRPHPAKLAEEAVYQLEHNIEKKVAGVLKDEISRYKKYGRQSGELGSLHAIYNDTKIKQVYQDGWTNTKSGERQEILGDPENAHIESENGDAIVTFYNGLTDNADKEIVTNFLASRLSRNKEYYCVSYLIFYVLFRIGKIKTGLDLANIHLTKQRTFLEKVFQIKACDRLLEPYQRYGFSDMLGLINGLLRYEHPVFSDRDLDDVEKFIDGIDEHAFRIGEKINSARSFRLSH